MSSTTDKTKRIHLVQGEYRVGSDPNLAFSTILGSCVAACLRDPISGIGGMNHFLLPADETGNSSSASERFGVHLMELLVNDLMRHGAHRDRLEAKVFGGARMIQGLSDIGKKNADFAIRFLKHEGIPIVASDLGGDRGRRLQYWPSSGRARQSYIASQDYDKSIASRRTQVPTVSDQIELFTS